VPTSPNVSGRLRPADLLTERGVADVLGVTQQTVSTFYRHGVLTAGEVRYTHRLRAFPLFKSDEVERFRKTQISCCCRPGCPRPAWRHAPFAPGHHLHVAALVLYAKTVKLIDARIADGAAPPRGFVTLEELRRGLCSVKATHVGHTGSPPPHRAVTAAQFESVVRLGYGLAAGVARGDLAADLGLSRNALARRVERLAEAGWTHTCKECTML